MLGQSKSRNQKVHRLYFTDFSNKPKMACVNWYVSIYFFQLLPTQIDNMALFNANIPSQDECGICTDGVVFNQGWAPCGECTN